MVVSVVLFTTALVNLFTKSEATIAGITFSAIFFGIFTYSEHRVAKARAGKPEGLAQFRVYGNEDMGSNELGVRPGNILVAVRDPKNLYYLREVLRRTDTGKQDVVVMTARLYHREHSFSGNCLSTPTKSSTTTNRNFSLPQCLSRKKKADQFPCW